MQKDNEQGGGNSYDKIVKENIEAIYENLIQELLGLASHQRESLKDKIQTTLEREMDSLYRVKDKDAKDYIIHIEFQSSNDPKMIYRMNEYHALILKKYKLPIRHVLVYLGDQKPRMRQELKAIEVFKSFEMIHLKAIKTEQFLSSDSPGTLILAILADYPKWEAELVIKSIMKRLLIICPNENDRLST